ncbi:DUF2513 domain-containing protein [Burkholderia sp. Ac-20345]|uniref:DUF2513 domain-containing protein n=1 Tax=Burkholderia sp. Ac-20345 TaxID=2703891 RepID=UPI00197C0CA2|nr:DUF2513 domain-containing protein [Burkholderia sp. Ac-20345]MBN3779958.1 DUF2513 domain-containing protein [Burkholderia sp. Ac-20345]
MQRDWQCIRTILQALADTATQDRSLGWGEVPPYDEETVLFHFRLLEEAGLIVGHPPGQPMIAVRPTWAGYELLDVLNESKFWSKIKSVAKEKGIALTFNTIGMLAEHVTKHLLR